MALTASISLLALVVSYFAFKLSKKSYEHALESFNIEYSNSLFSHLKITEKNEYSLAATFTLTNHGKNNVVINKVKLAGRAQSSVGDDYGVLNDTIGSDGTKVIEAGKTVNFTVKFIVGYGNLKSMKLTAYVQGVDSKQVAFRVALPVKVKYV